MMLKLALMAAAGALALAGCSSKPKEIDYSRVCPTKMTQQILANQQAFTMVEVGKTRFADLKGLGAPARKATLIHFGENDKVLLLYPTELASCPFMLPGATYTPVVLDDAGVIIGLGMQDMRDFHAKGWKVQEASWPWQDYNYAYLPRK